MQKIKDLIKKYPLEGLTLGFLYFSMIYYSYRYIFQMNSSATSPTYADTGFLEKTLKYIVIAALYILFVIMFFINKNYRAKLNSFLTKRDNMVIFGLFIIFLLYLLMDVVILHGFSISLLKNSMTYDYLLKFIFFIPIFFVIPFLDFKEMFKDWILFLKLSLIFQVIFTTTELFLYLVFHRLPALAYAKSLVRFGGAWDDPNSLAIFMIIVVLFAVFGLLNGKRNMYWYIVPSLILLFLTYSFTAAILLLGVVAILLFLKKFKEALILFVVIIAIAVGTTVTLPSARINILGKIPSAQQHIYQTFNVKVNVPIPTNIGVKPVVYPKVTPVPKKSMPSIKDRLIGSHNSEFLEDFYKQFIHNFGIIGAGLFILTIFSVFFFNYRKLKNYEYLVFGVFAILILLGGFALPYLEFFPVNVYFWVCLGFLLL